LSAGTPPQTLLGELIVLPIFPSWILGSLLLRNGEGGNGRKGDSWREIEPRLHGGIEATG